MPCRSWRNFPAGRGRNYRMESAKSRIIGLYLKNPGAFYAGHELGPCYKAVFGVFIGYSDNCLCTRLNELERDGYTLNGVFYRLNSRFREGKDFKEWGNLTQMPENAHSCPLNAPEARKSPFPEKVVCKTTCKAKTPRLFEIKGIVPGVKLTTTPLPRKVEQQNLF